MQEFDDRYEFHNYSGSIYVCYKNRQKMSGLTQTIYNNMLVGIGKMDDPTGTSVELVNF